MSPLVSSIVVNWNGRSTIAACLDSLLAQTHAPHEIIVVDNASTDGSLGFLKEKYASRVKLIENSQNTGFAGGVASGIPHARGEFIALLNSDASAKPDWIERLVRAMDRDPKSGMAASKIYLKGGEEGVLDNTGLVMTRDGLGRGRGRLEKDTGQYDAYPEALCPSGCAAFYRRSAFERAGGIDERFFLYAEDIDIGLRIRLAGYSCPYVPEAVVHHSYSRAAGALTPLKAFYVERNRLWVVLKCFPFPYLAAAPFCTLLRYIYNIGGLFTKHAPASEFREQFSAWRLAGILLKTYFSSAAAIPHLLRERRWVQKNSACAREFGAWLRLYGISLRRSALDPLI